MRLLLLATLVVTSLPQPLVACQSEAKPNIVLIMCDDLGIGDVQCFNPAGKIKTPNMEALAKQGMIFTDAHSGSSVCTPTRYGLLTGRYCWRTKLQSGVVQGFEPCLIAPSRPTLASFLHGQGYHCAIIGKWHLNMRFFEPTGKAELAGKPLGFIPPIGATSPDGPLDRGFDYFYGLHHARSMKAVIENREVLKHESVEKCLPALADKSTEYIQSRSATGQPFFLYVPLGSPHTPIVPTKQWRGASGLGDYADFVMQTDDVIGKIIQTIDDQGIANNTLVIVTSDNGCSRAAKIRALQEQGHDVSAGFRGSKSDIWDGGHRVPFICRWPGITEPKTTCDAPICLTDLFATIADATQSPTPAESCEDSVSFLPALRGEKIAQQRAGIIHHSISGHFAYRAGNWKLILARGSGGWSAPTEKGVSTSVPEAQLYDLSVDPGEQKNLYLDQPAVAAKLLKQLEQDVLRGRSTAGEPAKNDVESIHLWKSK